MVGSPDKGSPGQPAKPDVVAKPDVKAKPKRLSDLRIDPSKLGVKVTTKHDVVRDTKLNPDHKRKDAKRPDARQTKSDTREPVRSERRDARPMCKSRPTDNKPKDKPRGGGGGGKSFVPWKGTKYGC
jgi:hypothetical protein